MNLDNLISPEYLAEQKRLHASPRGYGGKGRKWADEVHGIAEKCSARSILDYGAGQDSLCKELRERGIKTHSYDPAIKRISRLPAPADMVVCTDVLEHIEPEKLCEVVAHLASLMRVVGFFVISLVPTTKTLSDGRQAHISLYNRQFWFDLIEEFFTIYVEWAVEEWLPEKQLILIVCPKGKLPEIESQLLQFVLGEQS